MAAKPDPSAKQVPGFVELLWDLHRSLKREGKLLPDEPIDVLALRYLKANPTSICTLREIHKTMPAVEQANLEAGLESLVKKGLVDKLPAGRSRFNYRLRPGHRPQLVFPKAKK